MSSQYAKKTETEEAELDRDKESIKLVHEIIRSLEENSKINITMLVRRALRLATLRRKPEYRLLFELHLSGFKTQRDTPIDMYSWNSQDLQLKWNPILAFIEDRRMEGEQIQTLPVDQLEQTLQAIENWKKGEYRGDGTAVFSLEQILINIVRRIRNRINIFATETQSQLKCGDRIVTSYFGENDTAQYSRKNPGKIFIGHGRSLIWKDLKDFLYDKLHLDWDEYDRHSVLGMTTKERLEQMLERAIFAFLILTAEDKHVDGNYYARHNVIHEAGLFQGRLGFRKAILLLEEGCQSFTNITGLHTINFPKGDLMARSEEIRRVLEREGIVNLNELDKI